MKKILLISCLVTQYLNLFAQENSYPIDMTLPAQSISSNHQLTVLNSRLGSRFSLSYVGAQSGVHTGALGFDMDEFSELLLELEVNGKSERLKTARMDEKTAYLTNQEVRIGMTANQLRGVHSSGLVVTATIVSPFTSSKTLEDTASLKTQIAPVFYIIVDIYNPTKKTLSFKFRTGLNRIAYDPNRMSAKRSWAYGYDSPSVLYRDNASSNTFLTLQTLDKTTKHFSQTCFQGLEFSGEVGVNQLFTNNFSYTTFHEGRVIYDKKYNFALKYYYTQFFDSINQVNAWAKWSAKSNLEKSQKFENILKRSKSTPEEKWVTALTFHSDMANTFLLLDPKKRARFYLLEGRFRHMSTVDVAHESEILAIFTPWRLKIQLEQWMDYMAREEIIVSKKMTKKGEVIHKEGTSAAEYGPFLYHDVGDFPYVAETEEYDFGPYMAVQENSTYIILLYWYWKITGDDAFVRTKLGMVDVLLQSNINRDTNGSGIADVAMGWTTYDANDAVKRSPENVFLGMLELNAYVTAIEMFEALKLEKTTNAKTLEDIKGVVDGSGKGYVDETLYNKDLRTQQANRYKVECEKIVRSLVNINQKLKYVPVSLDTTFKGWDQYSVVLGEGLFYAGLCGTKSDYLNQAAKVLSDSYKLAFEKSITPYGIKLTSGEPETWFSKIMVSDIVAKQWYGQNHSTAKYTYDWNKNNFDAYNDGAHNATSKWIGFWYPRGISSLAYLLLDFGFKANETDKFLNGLK